MQFYINNLRAVAQADWRTPASEAAGDIDICIFFFLKAPAYLIDPVGNKIKRPELSVMGMA